MTDHAITPTAKPRRMLEPTKDELRRQLEVANALVSYACAPWWVRLWARVKAWT
jgi:hypothetical protein